MISGFRGACFLVRVRRNQALGWGGGALHEQICDVHGGDGKEREAEHLLDSGDTMVVRNRPAIRSLRCHLRPW